MNDTTLGILGLGSETTAFYIRRLNQIYNIEKGGYSTCPYLLLNADFDKINPLLPYTSAALERVVQGYLSAMEELPIEHILVPNITLHETIDRLQTSKTIIHPVRLTLAEIKKNQWDNVVLLGSAYTMQSAYMASLFEAENIKVLSPSAADCQFIDMLRKQIYAKTENAALIAKYHSLVAKYSKGFPLVLACTELSIYNPRQGSMSVLDMVDIQLQQAVQQIL